MAEFSLLGKTCEPCQDGASAVTEKEIALWKPEIPHWDIKQDGPLAKLVRKFTFPDFASALEFTNKIGELAESANHHPAILTEWGSVTVSWWTHKISGLHVNDFIMAANTDSLIS